MADGSTNNNPLDLSQYISGVTNQAYTNWGTQQDQMKWAKDQFAKNSGTADTVSNRALDTSNQFAGYATRDQDLYSGSYIPAMKQQLDYAENYITPERMAANRAAAGATVANNAAAQRSASERALQSTGVDPSSGRFAGLDAGLAADAAAKSAAAMTTSDRTTEQLGQQYLAQAIQTGAVLPGQAVNEAGLGISAGNQAVNAPLAATASGAATMGTPLQWNAAGNDMYKQWASAAGAQASAGQAQQQIDLAREKQKQSESSGTGALIGAGMGVLGSVAGAYFGGPMGASLGGSLGGSLGKAAGGATSGGGGGGGGADSIMGLGQSTGGMTRRYYAEGGRVDDEEDMTDQYNTQLDPEEEQRYHDWAAQNHREGDTYDYDMRGAWKQGIEGDPRTGHYPDTYKKPNHPTFSDESQYDGAGGRRGGHWEEDETRSETLQPYGTHSHADGGMIDRFASGGSVGINPMAYIGDFANIGQEIGGGDQGETESPQTPNDPVATLWDTAYGKPREQYDEGERIGSSVGRPVGRAIGDYFTGGAGSGAFEEGFGRIGGGVGAAVQGHFGEGINDLTQGTPLSFIKFAEGGMPPDDDGASNMVPPEASPSGGANVDDVHAMVSEGEFVMPKDVTGWLGEKFMQNLINKARTEMAGPKAEGQPGPPVQAMALSPPSFRSEGARAGA